MVLDGDFVAKHQTDLYYVSIDTAGEIGWDSGIYRRSGRPDCHVIEVITEKTSRLYRSYLKKRGVSYIIAGQDRLDCVLALEKLHRLFGIEKLLICGGGYVNWSFVQAGVVDELSLLLSPVADGSNDSVTIFEKLSTLPLCEPVSFSLKSMERILQDGVHLSYLVNKK